MVAAKFPHLGFLTLACLSNDYFWAICFVLILWCFSFNFIFIFIFDDLLIVYDLYVSLIRFIPSVGIQIFFLFCYFDCSYICSLHCIIFFIAFIYLLNSKCLKLTKLGGRCVQYPRFRACLKANWLESFFISTFEILKGTIRLEIWSLSILVIGDRGKLLSCFSNYSLKLAVG